MSKSYKLKVVWEEDKEYGRGASRAEILFDEDGKPIYSVCNLNECSEDAIIARDLVSSYEIVGFIKLGMTLASEGYASVLVKDEKVESIY